jgi:hypothetical protein
MDFCIGFLNLGKTGNGIQSFEVLLENIQIETLVPIGIICQETVKHGKHYYTGKYGKY